MKTYWSLLPANVLRAEEEPLHRLGREGSKTWPLASVLWPHWLAGVDQTKSINYKLYRKIQLYQQSRSIQCAKIDNTHIFSPLKVVCPLVDSTYPFSCLFVGSIGQWIKICQHRPKAETYLQQNMTVITSIKVKRLIRLLYSVKEWLASRSYGSSQGACWTSLSLRWTERAGKFLAIAAGALV